MKWIRKYWTNEKHQTYSDSMWWSFDGQFTSVNFHDWMILYGMGWGQQTVVNGVINGHENCTSLKEKIPLTFENIPQ